MSSTHSYSKVRPAWPRAASVPTLCDLAEVEGRDLMGNRDPQTTPPHPGAGR